MAYVESVTFSDTISILISYQSCRLLSKNDRHFRYWPIWWIRMLRNWSKWSISFRSHFSKQNFERFHFKAKILKSFRNFWNWLKFWSISIDFKNFNPISIVFEIFNPISIKFRSIFDLFRQNFVKISASISTKFCQNFKNDRNWSKFRSISTKFQKWSILIKISINFDQFWKILIVSKWNRNFCFKTKFWKISFRKMGPKRNGPFRSISQHPGSRHGVTLDLNFRSSKAQVVS